MPSWVPIWLACEACGCQWDDWQPWGVPVKTWAAHLGTLHCPHCGKDGLHVLLRTQPLPTT
jgi:hypothetical protein